MNTQYLLNKLIQKQDLTIDESQLLLREIMQEHMNQIQISSLLTALAMKGESIDEIVGFIKTMRANMVPIHANGVIDVCGTGGDNKETFNVSTTVACVVAGAGIPVIKHGTVAASSACGSADVLKELGVHINLTAPQSEEILKRVGMVFLFAPVFHPAYKPISAIRRELKIRTVFNFLGPFANPASVKRQLIGVPNLAIAEKLAQVGLKLDYEHLLIVTSADGMDEISIDTAAYMYEIRNNSVSRSVITPRSYGFDYMTADMHGGDCKVNAAIIKNILSGKKGSQRDIVVFNSAFALYVSGKINNIHEGITLAEQSIDSGAAKRILESLVKETQHYA